MSTTENKTADGNPGSGPGASPGSDRRDSPRVPLTLRVRETGAEAVEVQGDISVGGAYYLWPSPPASSDVELTFHLPGLDRELTAAASIIRVAGNEGRFGVHVQFGELETRDELAVARFIDDHLLQLP